MQHKGNRRETRHPQISKLFYSIIFGENGYVSNVDIDKMKYELLDSALSIYTQNINIEHKSNMVNYIIDLSVFINEVQEPSAMVQRVVEELRGSINVLQRILARITRDEICCVFAEKCNSYNIINSQILLRWANAKNKICGAGSYEEENSALWIYHEACMNRKVPGSNVWLGWARDSSFSLDKKWSTIVILDYAMKFTHGETHVCKAYAECLMHNNCFEEARKTLRNMKNQNFGLPNLLIVEMIAGNTAEDDEYSVTTLIKRIESALEYSISAQYGLYMYYRYTKNKTEEYKYYSMLDLASRETLNIAQQMEEFLKDCQEAYNKVGFLSKDSDIL